LIALGPTFVKEQTELRAGPGSLIDESATVFDEAIEVDSHELSAGGLPALEESFESGLNVRSKRVHRAP